MRSFRSFALSAFVAFSFIAASIQPARALLPVWVGAVAYDTLVATASSVSIGVLARGFGPNDPYVKTLATIPRARLAENMSRSLRGRWAGLPVLMAALAPLGWYYDEETGLYTITRDFPSSGYCPSLHSVSSVDACVINAFGQYSSQGGFTNPVPVSCVNWIDNSACSAGLQVTQIYYCYYGVSSNSCESNVGTPILFNQASTTQKHPVPPSEIDAKGIPLLAASPKTMGDIFAGADPAMLNNLLDGATIPYEATKPSPQLAELMKQYRQGLLQSSDPNKPYYVDPDMMAKIQSLVAKEDALNTDDGKLDALNKSIEQPITQAQYEASNQKYADAVNSVTDSVSSENDFSDIDDHFKRLDDFVTDIPNTSLPSAAPVKFPQYSSCRQLNLTDGKGHELVFPNESQCAKLEDVKQGFGYFLYVLCAFGLVWQLLTRPTGG